MSVARLADTGLPFNRKERYFTGTVLPMLVCAHDFAHFGRLTELDLGFTGLTTAGVVALAESPFAVGLRFLQLDFTRLTQDALLALADSPHLAALERLDLTMLRRDDLPLTATALGRLVYSPRLPKLKEVRLPDPYKDLSLAELRNRSTYPL